MLLLPLKGMVDLLTWLYLLKHNRLAHCASNASVTLIVTWQDARYFPHMITGQDPTGVLHGAVHDVIGQGHFWAISMLVKMQKLSFQK